MTKESIQRIDASEHIRSQLLPHCRLKYGEVWQDSKNGHSVGCLDAASQNDVQLLLGDNKAVLAVHDPPYNIIVGNSVSSALGQTRIEDFIGWCSKWLRNTSEILDDNASLYIWLGADQNQGFQPLADFIIMMRRFGEFKTRSFITMRNQRGYGTQKNWMAVRQELLYYTKGDAAFNVEAEYTDIPKILRGYYKKVNGTVTENLERSKSENIRAGNVWVDIQQVFYRMEENVPGCYAQKPIKAIERIVSASSSSSNLVVDFFAHSGTTLLACEKLNRRCFTMDIDPIFAEIAIRRIERYRKTGKLGWQFESPFPEVDLKLSQEIGPDITATGKAAKQGLQDCLMIAK
ncbi:MAG: site-specific DNA-methyltransferase [Sedimentisphaerales bacterium]|nr:site-specific DNA-methyltransferase [Sedimentisphaerales bacterium]